MEPVKLSLRSRLATSFSRTRLIRWVNKRARRGGFGRLASLTFVFVIFLFMAGLLSAVLESSRVGGGLNIILRSRLAQTVYEVFINMSLLALGTLGIYLWYLGGRKVTGSREITIYFLLGTVLVLIATSLAAFILYEKGFF